MSGDINYWIPDAEKTIAALETAIAGKSDSAMVHPPWGDARPTMVRILKQNIERKRAEITLAREMFAQGKYLDGTPY